MALSTQSTSQSQNLEVVVQTHVAGVQDASTSLKEKEIFLKEWERRLEAREQDLNRREYLLHSCGSRPPVQAPVKMKCDYCGLYPCSRGGFCVDAFGRLAHRHHNCRSCHQEYRTYGCKGMGRGGKVD